MYKQPRNLQNFINKNKHPNHQLPKSLPRTTYCNRRRCKTYPIVYSTLSFSSSVINYNHKIPHARRCTSRYLLYLLSSSLCPASYVGEIATLLNIRMNNHRASCDPKTSSPLLIASHAKLYTNNSMTVSRLNTENPSSPSSLSNF